MSPEDRAVLDADPWFGTLPVERRDRLLGHARIRSVDHGATVYTIGDQPNGLWAVLSGQMRLRGQAASGQAFVALIVTPGTWFGEVSTIDGGPRPHDAVAFGATRAVQVPAAAIDRLAEAMPVFHRDFARLLCRHQRMALDHIAGAVSVPLSTRLARILAGRSAAADGALQLRQEDVATMLGVSRQTLNRHLRVLAGRGIVRLGYARIDVIDAAALHALADAG